MLKNTINVLEDFEIKEIFINVHYLSKQIISFIQSTKFNSKIFIIDEHEKILDTGGGILNATSNFANEPFFVLNPDTIWSEKYLAEFESMEKFFFKKKCQSILLVVNKKLSFDKTLNGDFNLENHLLNRDSDQKEFIYTGAQILTKIAFANYSVEPFSINKVWDKLILKNFLFGKESKQEFLHVTNLKVYDKLLCKGFKH